MKMEGALVAKGYMIQELQRLLDGLPPRSLCCLACFGLTTHEGEIRGADRGQSVACDRFNSVLVPETGAES